LIATQPPDFAIVVVNADLIDELGKEEEVKFADQPNADNSEDLDKKN